MNEGVPFALRPIPDVHYFNFLEACRDPNSRETKNHVRNWGDTLLGKNLKAKIRAVESGEISVSVEDDFLLAVNE